MRVLGVDPGLTRCGIGVVEKVGVKDLKLVACGVIQTGVDAPLEERLMHLSAELEIWINRMATGQAAGVALLLAAKAGVPIAMHTPSEVKAAVSGSGRADKRQVAAMVVRILKLKEAPKPVDTTDALALAICNHWRGAGAKKLATATAKEKSRLKRLKSEPRSRKAKK
jgi:crossover junction endodeoxyribonuclease RuvC